MPRRPVILPADRFFARLDKFECECPSCGEIIFAGKTPRARTATRTQPRRKSIWDATYNPVSQRLRCPHCHTGYVVGLLVYPLTHGQRRVLDGPPDTLPTSRQRAEMQHRRQAGGWYAAKTYTAADEVNLVVDSPCSCPKKGWAPACPIHGDPAYGGGELAGTPDIGGESKTI